LYLEFVGGTDERLEKYEPGRIMEVIPHNLERA
jgi:hypothetical protein